MSEALVKPRRRVYMILAALLLAFTSIFATSTPAQAAWGWNSYNNVFCWSGPGPAAWLTNYGSNIAGIEAYRLSDSLHLGTVWIYPGKRGYHKAMDVRSGVQFHFFATSGGGIYFHYYCE